MNLSGMILILLFAVSGCNEIKVKMHSKGSIVSSFQNFTVETADDGAGSEIDSLTLEVGNDYTFYAIKRDESGQFVENHAVSWSMTGSAGNLSILSGGRSSLFTPTTPGVSEVAINIGNGVLKVLTITVVPAVNPPLNVSNLVISGISTSGFTATIDFNGGSPTQSHTLYYCNNTASPGCIPTAGSSAVMSVSGATYTASVTGLTNPGNVFNVRVVSTDSVTVNGSPMSTTATLLYNNLAVSNLVISSITTTGFTATIDFAGGSPSQTHTLYYCNETASPGCNPAAGSNMSMTQSGAFYTVNVTGLTNPGDVYNVRAISTDSVTVSGSPLNTTATLAYPGLSVSNLVISGITTSGFTATIDFTGGSPAQTHTLYYCNNTATPGCIPTAGSSAAMSVSGATYTASVTGLTGPGNVFNVRVVSTDSVTVTGSPINTTATLLYNNLAVSGLAISAITSTGFRATIDYTGGSPSQSHIVYYCNETASAGCNPLAGGSAVMVNSGATYYANITGLVNPTNTFNVRVVSTDSVTVTGSPQNTTATLLGTGIAISGAVASNKTKTGMTITTNFTGDAENNALLALWYCNATLTPGCVPTSGASVPMTRSGTTYVGTIAGLSGPAFNEGDQLNLTVIATDNDGVTGSPINTNYKLADFFVTNLTISSISSTSFTASVAFTDDLNATGTVTLYYCNDTDSPACLATSGSSVVMTRSGSNYVATVTGLTTPVDPGDMLRFTAVGADPDGAWLHPTSLTKTQRIIDWTANFAEIRDVSSTQFNAKITVETWSAWSGSNFTNSVVTVYYCDATLSVGCDPKVSGLSSALAYDYATYRVNVMHTIPKGNNVNALIEVVDPDYVYGNGAASTTLSYPLTFKIPNPAEIFRSIGPGQSTALHDGAISINSLTIAGTNANFTSPLSNQVGVGDAIFYDADGDNLIDSLAFIHSRSDNQTYTVKSVNGNTPVSAALHTKWKLYRAYTALSNAENSNENSGIVADAEIPAGLRNFELWTSSGVTKDISHLGLDKNLNFALYAGTQADTIAVNFQNGIWKKDREQVIRIFTSHELNQVGVSQRHNGMWDNTKYRLVVNNANALGISGTRVHVEGLQIEITGTANDIRAINAYGGGEGSITKNIIRSSSTGTLQSGVFYYTEAVGNRHVLVSNNLVYNFSTTGSIGFNILQGGAYADGGLLYNNTLYNNTRGILIRTLFANILHNNIVLGSSLTDLDHQTTNYNVSKMFNNLTGDGSFAAALVWNVADKANNITGHLPYAVFLDHENEDFRLAPGSPAIGAGFDASAVITTDIIGNTRTPPFDIGAFQD